MYKTIVTTNEEKEMAHLRQFLPRHLTIRPKHLTIEPLSPENLSIDVILQTGKDYIMKHGKNLEKDSHDKISLLLKSAEKLKSDNVEAKTIAKWLFLANLYAELPHHNTEIASAVRKYFTAAFNEKIIYLQQHSYKDVKLSTRQLANIYLVVVNDYFVNTVKEKQNSRFIYR